MIPFFPVSASTLSPQVDLLFSALLVFSFGLGSFLVFLVLRFSIVYRSGSKADRSGSRARDPRLESIWIVGAVLFAFAMFAWGAALFLERDNVPAGAMQILGIGKQWMWKFEHANGRREINTLHVPVDQPVVVTLGSQDVIHSLYLPEFRIKQDAVPGQTTRVWFEATRTGTFDLFCAEYCGDQHSEMRGSIVVMEKADFAAWLGTGNADLTLVQQGEALFRSYGCSGCHGPGSTLRAPDLHGVYGGPVPLTSLTTVRADERYIRDSILDPSREVAAGYAPIMPSFAGLIEEPDLQKLIAYIKSIGSAGDVAQ